MTPLFVIAYLLSDQLLAQRQTEASPTLITTIVAATTLLGMTCALRLPDTPPAPKASLPATQGLEVTADTDV